MATATFDAGLVGQNETASAKSKNGLFGRIVKQLIAARENEARKRAATALASISDRSLLELGLSARDIEVLRHGTKLNVELTG